MKRISRHQKAYLAYIAFNPGCSAADIVRACQENPQAGHRWVYDGIKRLLRRGFLVTVPVRDESRRGGAMGLEVAP